MKSGEAVAFPLVGGGRTPLSHSQLREDINEPVTLIRPLNKYNQDPPPAPPVHPDPRHRPPRPHRKKEMDASA
ncbi:hypothetical protein EYF80_067301 [Liparis tanakae]|uniref:Uncharacterized protein n=1 Tax=Liparis tanakae TaxID=230148 RepID=A0A4Z2E1D0_9TELE|nr:hypothetical protein EYF80_067301 [Liparis tanakae]